MNKYVLMDIILVLAACITLVQISRKYRLFES
jgi:hypothetical protein